jgi:hypothetical protein
MLAIASRETKKDLSDSFIPLQQPMKMSQPVVPAPEPS